MSIAIFLLLSGSGLLSSGNAMRKLIQQDNGRKFEKIPFPKPLLLQPDTISLVFMGDMMMHHEQIRKAYDPMNMSYSFSEYLSSLDSIISSADLAVANMEFTLAGEPYSGYPCFSAPDSYSEYLKGAGIDIFLTANNHILDKGTDGMRRTLAKYSQEGIFHTGSAASAQDDSLWNPLLVAVRGIRIAFVNATYGTNGHASRGSAVVHRLDSADVERMMNIAEARGADLIIAMPHWGVEYSLRHSPSQRRWAEFFIRHGADAVIGAHPHVVQDVQTIDGVPVVYSMGNIVSNMSADNTRVGLIVTLRIAVSSDRECSMLEPEYAFTWCARPGALTDDYKAIPIRQWMGRKDEWLKADDFSNMCSSYERVKEKTGISDIQ